MKVTKFECELLWALRDMVIQNCDTRDADRAVYFSAFIRPHADAMRLLCRAGFMKMLNDAGGRVVTAMLIDDGLVANAFGKDVGIPVSRLLKEKFKYEPVAGTP